MVKRMCLMYLQLLQKNKIYSLVALADNFVTEKVLVFCHTALLLLLVVVLVLVVKLPIMVVVAADVLEIKNLLVLVVVVVVVVVMVMWSFLL